MKGSTLKWKFPLFLLPLVVTHSLGNSHHETNMLDEKDSSGSPEPLADNLSTDRLASSLLPNVKALSTSSGPTILGLNSIESKDEATVHAPQLNTHYVIVNNNNGVCVRRSMEAVGLGVHDIFEIPCDKWNRRKISVKEMFLLGHPSYTAVSMFTDEPNTLYLFEDDWCTRKTYSTANGLTTTGAELLSAEDCVKAKKRVENALKRKGIRFNANGSISMGNPIPVPPEDELSALPAPVMGTEPSAPLPTPEINQNSGTENINSKHIKVATNVIQTPYGHCEVDISLSGRGIQETVTFLCADLPKVSVNTDDVFVLGHPSKNTLCLFSDGADTLFEIKGRLCNKKIYTTANGLTTRKSSPLTIRKCNGVRKIVSEILQKQKTKPSLTDALPSSPSVVEHPSTSPSTTSSETSTSHNPVSSVEHPSSHITNEDMLISNNPIIPDKQPASPVATNNNPVSIPELPSNPGDMSTNHNSVSTVEHQSSQPTSSGTSASHTPLNSALLPDDPLITSNNPVITPELPSGPIPTGDMSINHNPVSTVENQSSQSTSSGTSASHTPLNSAQLPDGPLITSNNPVITPGLPSAPTLIGDMSTNHNPVSTVEHQSSPPTTSGTSSSHTALNSAQLPDGPLITSNNPVITPELPSAPTLIGDMSTNHDPVSTVEYQSSHPTTSGTSASHTPLNSAQLPDGTSITSNNPVITPELPSAPIPIGDMSTNHDPVSTVEHQSTQPTTSGTSTSHTPLNSAQLPDGPSITSNNPVITPEFPSAPTPIGDTSTNHNSVSTVGYPTSHVTGSSSSTSNPVNTAVSPGSHTTIGDVSTSNKPIISADNPSYKPISSTPSPPQLVYDVPKPPASSSATLGTSYRQGIFKETYNYRYQVNIEKSGGTCSVKVVGRGINDEIEDVISVMGDDMKTVDRGFFLAVADPTKHSGILTETWGTLVFVREGTCFRKSYDTRFGQPTKITTTTMGIYQCDRVKRTISSMTGVSFTFPDKTTWRPGNYQRIYNAKPEVTITENNNGPSDCTVTISVMGRGINDVVTASCSEMGTNILKTVTGYSLAVADPSSTSGLYSEAWGALVVVKGGKCTLRTYYSSPVYHTTKITPVDMGVARCEWVKKRMSTTLAVKVGKQ